MADTTGTPLTGRVRQRAGLLVTARSLRLRLGRLRDRSWMIAQAAVGAALAWWVASTVLGHPLPFFAPVTAMVCLGLTYDNRVRRVIELTIGVAIGVFVGDLFVQLFGSGVWQIAAVSFIAMSLAVLAGAGQLLMLQAGIQGVIVATLVAGDGEALSRWVDALVGGGVALVIAVVAPGTSTVRRPRERAIAVVAHLASALGNTAEALRERDVHRAREALSAARGLHSEMEELTEAATEGLAVARLAPLRRQHRSGLLAIGAVLEPLDLAIRNVRVLVRRAEVALSDGERVPDSYVDMVDELAMATQHIADELAAGRSAEEAREDLVHLARASTWSRSGAGLSSEVMRAQVRSTVVDLLVLTGMTRSEARQRVPQTRDDLDPGPGADGT
ncbi:FUSC family protein [Ornithinimicrobium sediminis]|uniref:FUSC family protein n=1 Tax=Ornithinimicrobium sediminis TaxID=2904603 RepID=UPI001E50C179|nr:FUSC family protein [Ornithinimicrobium sediminis]